jgi:hypothetical protein
MTIDEAIEIYTQQTNVTEHAVSVGIRKIDMVILFDLLDKLDKNLYDNSLIRQVEETIALIAGQSFDEGINSILHEIKMTIKKIKSNV